MKLSPQNLKELVNAIISAYPSKADLAIMVEFELGENLDAIAGGKNLTQIVFDLVAKWAVPRGKVTCLVIAAYNTNPENPEIKKFYSSFVVEPRLSSGTLAKPSEFGPNINWRGENDEVQLQSWLKPKPDYWDVGFLKRAIQQSASVCRIEIASRQIMGTGVLIASNKILTNYHVLKATEEDDLKNNALNAVLKFGCITSEDGGEIKGKSFGVDKKNPILSFSKTEDLDYILLEVDSVITQDKDIKPARWDRNTLPITKMGINVLQHPEGDSMKLSVSQDGITGVYQERGVVQYVNKTTFGSSGSPCFDENWYLVALHHAQRAKSFGTIREGILFSAIYQEIKDFLI